MARVQTQVSRGLVVLLCANGHDHQMAPWQAMRIRHEPCCWCKAPIVRIDLSHLYIGDDEFLEALSA